MIKDRPPLGDGINIRYYVVCNTCLGIREEDGAFMDPPNTILDFDNRTTREEALRIAKSHEKEYLQRGHDHEIEVRAVAEY